MLICAEDFEHPFLSGFCEIGAFTFSGSSQRPSTNLCHFMLRVVTWGPVMRYLR